MTQPDTKQKYWEGTLYSIEGKIKGKFENGQVTLEDSSQRYVGEYKNGKRWNGKLYHLWKGNVYDEDGTLISKYVNGKEIKLNNIPVPEKPTLKKQTNKP